MNNFANLSGVFSVLSIDLNPVKNTGLVFRVNLQKTSDLINYDYKRIVYKTHLCFQKISSGNSKWAHY